MADLDGRRLLVTGASSGIGESVARAVVDAGAGVALLARRADALEVLAAELGDRAVAVPADVTDQDGVEAAVRHAVAGLGGLDGVVNAAGVVHPGGIADGDADGWQQTFDVNVVGLLRVTQAALPHLRDAAPADVVNISSMSGRRRASVAMTVYSASKHAVHVVSDGLREEVGADGVRVTIVSPGYVQTPIFDRVDDDELRDRYQAALADKGLDPALVADQVVHALGQPPGVDVLEIAVVDPRQ